MFSITPTAMEETAKALLLLAAGTLGALMLLAAGRKTNGTKRDRDELPEETALTPSAEELDAARKALDLATERMGTNPVEVEQAHRERDDLLEVMMPVARQDALVRASHEGKVAIVKRLLGAGADKDGVASEAADDGRQEQFLKLKGYTALAAAARGGHVPVVELLLRAGADREKGDTRNGLTPLMLAAGSGHAACLERLLEAGAAVDARRSYGCTALHLASAFWNHECVKLLLSKGASVDARSPLHLALRGVSHPDRIFTTTDMQRCELCVRLLLDNGADKDAQNNSGNTPLSYAVGGNRRNLVEMLLEAGCNVNLRNEEGITPLMHAASHNRLDIVNMLLKAGANKMLEDREGKPALQRADEKGHTEVAALLRE